MYPNNNCNDCSPCPGPVTPLPLPDLSQICGDQYNAECVIYTGPNIECLGITTGMTFVEILNIFNIKLCGCCTPVCFTFGSGLCDNAPDGTQVLAYATGLYNNKPYFLFDVCGTTQVFWFNSTDNLWYNSSVLGVSDLLTPTLNNGGQYLPLSNRTSFLWNNPDPDEFIYILESTINSCPTYKICFHLRVTLNNIVYNFYNYIAPIGTPFDTSNHPVYNYDVVILGDSYSVAIYYDVANSYWVALFDGNNIGTLPSNTLYPFGNWIPNPLNPGSFFVSALLGESCTQPPDVDCVIDCGPWSECIGGTETRICVVVTPPAGNGAPCGPLVQTRQCSDPPVCFPPFDIVVTENGVCGPSGNVTVAFTAAPGADFHTITYTINGVLQPALPTQSSSPFLLPYVCNEAVYAGTITTTCTNDVVSSSTPFSFTTRTAEIINNGELKNRIYQSYGASFKPDGLMYFTSEHNGTNTDDMASYQLATAWNVSTINLLSKVTSFDIGSTLGSSSIWGHVFRPNGSNVFICGNASNQIIKLTLTTPWDISTFIQNPLVVGAPQLYSTGVNAPKDIYFTPNGQTMFVRYNNGNLLHKYTLTIPWDISAGNVTLVVPEIINNLRTGSGFTFENNGTCLFFMSLSADLSLVGSFVVKRTLSTPYDLTTLSVDTSGPGGSPADYFNVAAPNLFINSGASTFPSIRFQNGCKGFVSAYGQNIGTVLGSTVYAFELTCPWDISSRVIITP